MKIHRAYRSLIPALTALILLTACTAEGDPARQPSDGGGMEKLPYLQIDQETAKQMMEADDGHVIVDVRRQEEYDAGHIPGAILIPNESIGSERPEALPDLYQTILIYCRSGNRSKQAAQKLADLGYANLYEFGGILDWKGSLVTSEQEAAVESTPTLVIEVNGKVFCATLDHNPSAEAFVEKLSPESIEVQMHDCGGSELVGALPWTLEKNDARITAEPGDIVLSQGDQIAICCDRNTRDLTRLAEIGSVTREELQAAFGEGSVTVRFHLEWSE